MRSRPPFPLFAALCLAGCGPSYYVRDLRSEYQSAEIPSLFGEARKGKTGFRLTGFAAYNRQREIRFPMDTTYWIGSEMDEEPRPLHGEASIARLPSLAGASAAYLGGPFLAGLAFAIAPDERVLAQGGGLFGVPPHFGAWTPMVTIGTFLTRVHTRLDYLSSVDDSPYSDAEIKEDTVDGVFWDFGVPLKAGLQYSAGPVAAYVIAGRSGTGVWPFRRGDMVSRFTAGTRDASLGVQVAVPLGLGIALEGGREWVDIPDRFADSHWKGRAFLMWDLPLWRAAVPPP